MFKITEAKKTEVLDYMLALPKSIRPRGMGDIPFDRLKAVVVQGSISLRLYEDFISNFFQVLYQLAIESKRTKPYPKS